MEKRDNICDGVMYKGVNLVPCTRKPQNMTEELLRYCDHCIVDYNKSRAKDPELPYNPEEYDGYVLSTERR